MSSSLDRRLIHEVWDEADRAFATFGPQTFLPDGTRGTLAANVAHAQDLVARKAEDGTLTWWDVLAEEVCEAQAEVDAARLRAELIQVAAVALRWVQAIEDREHDRAARHQEDYDEGRAAQ